MSSGMVISGSMVASFLENRPFTRSLSGKRAASSSETSLSAAKNAPRNQPKLEEVRNVQSDTELLTSFGEATLPSPGALDNHESMSQFLTDVGPSPKWGDVLAKAEWPGLGEELPNLFDAHANFPSQRPNTDTAMPDSEEGINGSVEQSQPPASADVNMGDVDNGNVENDVTDHGGTAATDTFLSSLFDWDKLGNTPTPKKNEGGQGGGGTSANKQKAPSPAAIRYTRSRSFELRRLVEQKGYSADNVMKAIDEGKVDPAVVWAKAAAENAAASRPSQTGGVKTEPIGVNRGQGGANGGQGEKERVTDMAEELKRLVNRNNQTTVPIRGSSRQSPGPSPLSYLSPRLRELLDAQLPDTPTPSVTQSEGASGNAAARGGPSIPPLMTVPLTQPRHRGRPQPLKGLTSAQKIEPLRPTSSDPGSLSKKRGPATEMLPPVKRSSSSHVSDNNLGRTSSSISEVVRAYSEIRTSERPPAGKPAETKRRGRGEKETKQQQRKTPQAQAQPKLAPTPAASVPGTSPGVGPSAGATQIQLLIKAQKADQLEEENRGLKQYLTFLSKKDGLQTKLIEQLEQQLLRVTDERDKLLAAAKKR